MPLCCETSLVANNQWDQLFIEQVLQLTSHHRWTQFALLGYQVTLVAFCQHLMWHKGSRLFSPTVSMLLFLSLIFHNSIVLCMLLLWCESWTSFLACIFWGLYQQRNCSPTSRLQRGDVGFICTALSHGTSGKQVYFLLSFFSPHWHQWVPPLHVSWSPLIGFVFLHSSPRWMKDWELLWGLMRGRGGFLNVRNSAMYLRLS